MNYALIALIALLTACGSRSIKPDVNEVKLSREKPKAKCKSLGGISGTTVTAKGTQDEAIEDLKRDAANKGANYIYVQQFSSYGTTVTGEAFECP